MPSARLKISAPEKPNDKVLLRLFCESKTLVANNHCLQIQARTVSQMAVSLLQLMREAETHLGQLVNMLRAPGVATLPGAVAIVAVKAAGSIAQQRPFFMNKVLPVLIALGSAQVGFLHIALRCFDGSVFTCKVGSIQAVHTATDINRMMTCYMVYITGRVQAQLTPL